MARQNERSRRRERTRLRTGEFELIAAIEAGVRRGNHAAGVVVGIGDDAAVLAPSGASIRVGRGLRASAGRSRRAPRGANLVVTTDSMVDGVHFKRAWLTPRELGVRAWRVAVSDIAAMGAQPRWVLLSLEVPPGVAARDVVALVRGLAADARRTGTSLVGGNLSRGRALALTVTVIGESDAAPLLRSGAKPGDLVYVTGRLGGSAAARLALGGQPRRGVPATVYKRPPLRVEFSLAAAKRGLITSMIDVSDGLLQDLGHIARRSGVAVKLDSGAVPIHPAARMMRANAAGALELALTGGEDYELAFTVRPSRVRAIESVAAAQRVRITPVGVVARGAAGVTDARGEQLRLGAAGFDHFRSAAGSKRR